jgi:hypothetical protein
MTYLSDKTNINKKRFYYFIILCALGIVVYFWPSIRIKLYPYVEPLVVTINITKNFIINIPSSTYRHFSSLKKISEQNTSLLLTIERLENEIAEKDAFIKENNFIMNGDIFKPISTIVLYPVMKDITTMYSTILFSKGFKSGVEEKSTVYLRGKQPVCVISQVYDSTSLCKLLSAPGTETQAVDGATNVTLFLIGIGGGAFTADVTRNTNVNVGDNIYLASDQTMKLGEVVDIIRNDQDTAVHVYVRGMYNPLTSSVFYINKYVAQ